VAADFFTVEVWTRKGLQRFMILFFIELSIRKVEIAGISSVANGLWMTQIARNVTDAVDGILQGKRYLIHDRDPLYTAEFLTMLQGRVLVWSPSSYRRGHQYALRNVTATRFRIARTFCGAQPWECAGSRASRTTSTTTKDDVREAVCHGAESRCVLDMNAQDCTLQNVTVARFRSVRTFCGAQPTRSDGAKTCCINR
jgi:hypothetical protein